MLALGGISEARDGVGGGTAYTAAQVMAFLAAPVVVEDWTIDLLDAGLRYKADLSPFTDRGGGADISHDTAAAIHRTLSLPRVSGAALAGAQGLLAADLIRVWYKLGVPDGGWLRWPLGTFMQPAPPVTDSQEAATWLTIKGSDFTQFLTETTFTSSYAADAGTTFGAAIRAIITLAGGVLALPGMVNIVDSGKTLDVPIGWDSGVSLLTAVNELLLAIGNVPAYASAMGPIQSGPLPDFSTLPPSFTFDTTTGFAMVVGSIKRSPDAGKIINACKVVGEDARKVAVSGSYTNNSADSPISVPRLGRTKLLLVKDSKIADVPAATARAKYEVQVAAANYAPITMATYAWPFSENLDVYRLVYTTPDEGLVSYLVMESKWSHHLGAGGWSTHDLNVVVAV